MERQPRRYRRGINAYGRPYPDPERLEVEIYTWSTGTADVLPTQMDLTADHADGRLAHAYGARS